MVLGIELNTGGMPPATGFQIPLSLTQIALASFQTPLSLT
jgi:hypothetical protein